MTETNDAPFELNAYLMRYLFIIYVLFLVTYIFGSEEKIRKTRYYIDNKIVINVLKYYIKIIFLQKTTSCLFITDNILIFIKIKYASEETFDAYYRFFFGKISASIKKRKREKEGRKEGRTAGL